MTPAILTDNLSKTYGRTRALDGLTIQVERGEIFGFLGPNGAGKTTTIRLLLDLIRSTSGSARILGLDCQLQSTEVRGQVGYLPGDVRLYSDLSGRENVEYICNLRSREVDMRAVESLAERLQLSLDHPVSAYSKGNRQKLALLLALLDQPRVLLLDEPTSGLDPLMQQVVWDILREATANGATIFFSSHVMQEVEEICERVGILRSGRLVAVEPIAALKGRTLRRIEVTFALEPPRAAFAIPDVREVARRHNTIVFEITGNLDAAVKAIATFPVLDLRTEQPSLEEILLTYYREAQA